MRIIRPDGSRRWLAVRGRVVSSASVAGERLVGIALDITERRQVEEELKQADRRKDEFLAMLAHELRNPLAAISNAVRLSCRSDLGAKDQVWVHDMLDRQTDLLVRLVDDLLDVARIARGRIELRRETLPLVEVINRAVESVRLPIERAHHQLDVQFGDQTLWVDGDRARLEQVIVNLLGNAAKYTPEGGKIWLQLARKGDAALISVADSGIGISREMLPRIFDMFAQAEQGLARSQGGLGIGLTLVRRLVELHGGAITAESPGPGEGSTFTIRLPLAEAPHPQLSAPRSIAAVATPDTQPLRVLIVDDNRDAAMTLGRLLRFSGCQTEVAFDGSKALELASQFRPQMALLDIGMPTMDGYELARRLKRNYPGIFIAAVSGYGQAADRERSKEAGFDEHFIKPVKLERLLSLLEEPSLVRRSE
jgi:signal transduction histidine kinase/ActR/RegA family two-component response regulator